MQRKDSPDEATATNGQPPNSYVPIPNYDPAVQEAHCTTFRELLPLLPRVSFRLQRYRYVRNEPRLHLQNTPIDYIQREPAKSPARLIFSPRRLRRYGQGYEVIAMTWVPLYCSSVLIYTHAVQSSQSSIAYSSISPSTRSCIVNYVSRSERRLRPWYTQHSQTKLRGKISKPGAGVPRVQRPNTPKKPARAFSRKVFI